MLVKMEAHGYKQKHYRRSEEELALMRLPKRLAYILRYGVLKEGLQADENGFVNLDCLLQLELLQDYTRQQVLGEIVSSLGYRAAHRYNWCDRDGQMFVRASYLRNFEKSPYHGGTKIYTLFECAMTQVLDHLDDYDLQDFPDEYIITTMIHRLKRQKKLSLKSLKTLLTPTLTHLDLEGIYLTNNIFRAVWTQCPHLVAVSLKNCGYIVTDTVLVQLTKNLPKLQILNLNRCNHLTVKCLTILSRHLPHLQVLHICGVPSLTYEAVLHFMMSSNQLKFLDVYYLRTSLEEYQTLTTVAKDQGLQVVIRQASHNRPPGLTEDNDQAESNSDGEDVDEDSEED
ncbi:unnamed protein product [Candidula unifasciata]|uniref:2'-phosphotransferase n=1 Tax=Candidula unifasciata TaxID=100452 RepID=A0A8S3ZZZ0_9EUPU|nr:unnamed protein product [Candidula unifasciata]